MRFVTSLEVTAALALYAEQENIAGTDGWRFTRTDGWHPDGEVRQIAEFCLMLGQPVSDILTGALMLQLVQEIYDMQTMIQRMHT